LDDNATPLTMAISTTHAAVTNNALNNTETSENPATSTEPISYAVGILAVLLLLMGALIVVMLILYVHKEKQRNSETNISIEYTDYWG
jgi:beta-lactamase regulating signal transducer with metallopeptidase domain